MNRYTVLGGLVIVLSVGGAAVCMLLFLTPSQPSSSSSVSTSTFPIPTQSQPTQARPPVTSVGSSLQRIISNDAGEQVELQQIAIAGDYAIWDWSGQNTGGEALLRFDTSKGQWLLVTDGGGAWSQDGLVQFGVPQDAARSLISQVPH